MLPFKRGAFYGLNQCHPVSIKYTGCNVKPSISVLVEDLAIFVYMCHWRMITAEVIVMPAFQPNEYLWRKHADKGKEKWEIYAWAVRDLIAKVGGFGKHDIAHREKIQYFKYIHG